MPVPTVEKVVRVRSDRIKPELRGQFGITAEQLTTAGRKGIAVSKIQIPDYKTFEEMLAGEAEKLGGDVNAAKAQIFKYADTQLGTSMRNAEAKKFEAPPVSKSVSQADAINWAKEHDKEGLIKAIDGELMEYIETIKTKILAERQAAIASGEAVETDEEEDNNA